MGSTFSDIMGTVYSGTGDGEADGIKYRHEGREKSVVYDGTEKGVAGRTRLSGLVTRSMPGVEQLFLYLFEHSLLP